MNRVFHDYVDYEDQEQQAYNSEYASSPTPTQQVVIPPLALQETSRTESTDLHETAQPTGPPRAEAQTRDEVAQDVDNISPKKYIHQPGLRVKDSEPAPQFYYQPQSVQREYEFHVQKEEPLLPRHTFVPVQPMQKEYHHHHIHHHHDDVIATEVDRDTKPKPKPVKVIQTKTKVKNSEKPTQKEYVYHVHSEKQAPAPIQQHDFVPIQNQKQHDHDYYDFDAFSMTKSNIYKAPPLKQERLISNESPPLREKPIQKPAQIEKKSSESEIYPMSKPPTPPPLPPVSTSNPPSTFTSRKNTLKRAKPVVHKKTPWSMEEVLMKQRQLKPRVERRYHPSHADEPVPPEKANNFEHQLLRKIVGLKQQEEMNYDDHDFKKEAAKKNTLKRYERKLNAKIHDLKHNLPPEELQNRYQQQPPRKQHYIDISLDERPKEDSKEILSSAKAGLRKTSTKNLQEDKKATDPPVEQKVKSFDMDKLLNKNNIWLKDHGTPQGHQKAPNSDETTSFLKDTRSKLRHAEPANYNNISSKNTNQAPVSIGDNETEKKWGNPQRRKFPKQTVVDILDDMRSADKSPSILGSIRGSLSSASQKRLEDTAKRFEQSRKNSSASSSGSESALVDSLFKNVYAENDLTSSDSLIVRIYAYIV